jgi:hypothetical protein
MTDRRTLREQVELLLMEFGWGLSGWNPNIPASRIAALLAAPAPTEKRHGCTNCGERFDDFDELYAHVDRHGEAPADAPPATPTPGLDRACLNCEGHGVVRHYLNRAGEFDKSHCPNCAGTGRQRLNVIGNADGHRCAAKIAREALLAAPAPTPTPGWQDISTAPKDGTRILIHTPSSRLKVTQAWWARPYEAAPADQCWWQTAEDYHVLPEHAAHWMPMPPAPTGGRE